MHIFYCYQEIKIDHQKEGLNSCKIELYHEFLKRGVKTWETVLRALEMSKHINIMKEVKRLLIKDYM